MASLDMNALSLGQPQQSPFQTQSAPTVQQQLAQHRAMIQQLSNPTSGDQSTERSMSQNPWAPDEIDPKDLQQTDRDHQAWLSTQPVHAQTYKNFDDSTHQNILRNLENDPALNEISTPFMDILQQLKGYVDQGIITKEQALQHLSEAAPMIEDAVNKHHGSGSVTSGHLLTTDPDMHVTPEILNKARKAKGAK